MGYNFQQPAFASTASTHSEVDALKKVLRHLAYKRRKARKAVKISLRNYRFNKAGYGLSRSCSSCSRFLAQACLRYNLELISLSYTLDNTSSAEESLDSLLSSAIESSGTLHLRAQRKK